MTSPAQLTKPSREKRRQDQVAEENARKLTFDTKHKEELHLNLNLTPTKHQMYVILITQLYHAHEHTAYRHSHKQQTENSFIIKGQSSKIKMRTIFPLTGAV